MAVSPTVVLSLFFALVLRASAEEPKRQAFHGSVSAAIEQAHAKLWSGAIDQFGIIHDYIGEIPTPEDCTLGRPNVIGWWSPIENGPMFTGLYLPAACERARRSGDPRDKANARRLAAGLLKCASVSEVPGFIARGVGTDGQCHYPLGSDDQTHPWFYGLHTYLQSGIPDAEERTRIVVAMKKVADVLESTGWNCPCDGAFSGQFRGGFAGHLFRDAVRYLFILRAMYEVTDDGVWLERYEKGLRERPRQSEKSRAEICAAGYGPDRAAIPSIDLHNLWIYVGSQGSLARLRDMERDASVQAQYRAGLVANALNVAPAIQSFGKFDNSDTQLFGHAHWREGYTTWFPQKTQADAAKLAETGNKATLGGRKNYEARYVKHPLAAAAILALAGDAAARDTVSAVLCHYDYSKLSMSEYFLAECAYYALPPKPAE
jgi:hypothetical protein